MGDKGGRLREEGRMDKGEELMWGRRVGIKE